MQKNIEGDSLPQPCGHHCATCTCARLHIALLLHHGSILSYTSYSVPQLPA